MWRTRLSVLPPHLTICELLAVPEDDHEDLRACTMRLLPPHPVPGSASGRPSGRGALGHRDHPPLPPPPSSDLVTPPAHTPRREDSRTVRRSRRPIGRPQDLWWHDAVAPVCSPLRCPLLGRLCRRPPREAGAPVARRVRGAGGRRGPGGSGAARVNPDGTARLQLPPPCGAVTSWGFTEVLHQVASDLVPWPVGIPDRAVQQPLHPVRCHVPGPLRPRPPALLRQLRLQPLNVLREPHTRLGPIEQAPQRIGQLGW